MIRLTPAAGLAAALLALAAPALAQAPAGVLTPGNAGVQAATPRPPAREYASAAEHYAALKAQAKGGTRHTYATLPDWSGVWTQAGGLGYGRPTPAPLNAEYRARYDKVQADVAKGIEYDRLSTCLPSGMPRWVSEPYNKEFYPMPDRVILSQEFMNETRRVYTDGRAHTPDDEIYPTWLGDSIGFWNKDVLVIWTTGTKAGEYQRNEPEYSDQTQTIEQWRKVDPDTIEIQMSVYDPVTLTRPWHVAKLYRRNKAPDQRIRYWECEETNNVVRTADGGTTHILPGEPGYNDPDKIDTQASVAPPAR